MIREWSSFSMIAIFSNIGCFGKFDYSTRNKSSLMTSATAKRFDLKSIFTFHLKPTFTRKWFWTSNWGAVNLSWRTKDPHRVFTYCGVRFISIEWEGLQNGIKYTFNADSYLSYRIIIKKTQLRPVLNNMACLKIWSMLQRYVIIRLKRILDTIYYTSYTESR